MSYVEEEIVVSVHEAVRKKGVDKSVADRIVAWFESVARGNTRPQDADDAGRRLDGIFSLLRGRQQGETEE